MERLRHRLFGQFAVYAGNTAALARTLAEAVDADVCEIRTLEPYPADYRETTEAAKRELAAQARPAIAGELPDLSDRDEIYLGYPIWWGKAPRVILSFVDASAGPGRNCTSSARTKEAAFQGASRNFAKSSAGRPLTQRSCSRGTALTSGTRR